VIIVETKGSIFSNDKYFKQKKDFMQSIFVEKNNKEYGYERFYYLYLEDSLTEVQRIEKASNAIKEFFIGE
jgi:hypothetical protein